MADVFISYSSNDSASAEYLRNTLESMYLTCWMAPRDIPTGENFADCIPAAMRNAKVFLILVSQNSLASVQVLNELTFASHIGLPRIAVRLDSEPLNNAFQYHIAEANRYDGKGRLAGVSNELVFRIHQEIKDRSQNDQKRKTDTNLRRSVPLVWLLLVTICTVVLVCGCCICLSLQVITVSTFLRANCIIVVFALLAAALIRTPLFREDHIFFQKFLKLMEKLLSKL